MHIRSCFALICFISIVFFAANLELRGSDQIDTGINAIDKIRKTKADFKSQKKKLRAKLLEAQATQLESRSAELIAKAKKLKARVKTLHEENSEPETLQSVSLDGIELVGDIPFGKLQTGTRIRYGNEFHKFIDIPKQLDGRHFTNRHGYQGILRFRVSKSQTLFMAMYGGEWGVGGNPSGGWKEEVVSREDLEKQGWRETNLLPVTHSNPDYAEQPSWIVFSRKCESGESFAIRNHKYQAPVLIWGNKS